MLEGSYLQANPVNHWIFFELDKFLRVYKNR